MTSLETIRHHVQLGGTELETGGILLGHEHVDGCRIVVAGGPGPNALRTPVSFNRDRAFAERLADKAWHEHRAVWLGEWHTHPRVPPVPSTTDLSSYARHLADPELRFTRFISIIVGPPQLREPGGSAGSHGQPPASRTPWRSGHDAGAHPGEELVAMTWVIDLHDACPVPLQPIEDEP